MGDRVDKGVLMTEESRERRADEAAALLDLYGDGTKVALEELGIAGAASAGAKLTVEVPVGRGQQGGVLVVDLSLPPRYPEEGHVAKLKAIDLRCDMIEAAAVVAVAEAIRTELAAGAEAGSECVWQALEAGRAVAAAAAAAVGHETDSVSAAAYAADAASAAATAVTAATPISSPLSLSIIRIDHMNRRAACKSAL